ncbi:MAG: phosphoribosylanthranilate isomerase [Ruminococcus sp.]|nr:phosphoribosylanthranilate isomerase [Ruminococcus sp.]
MNSKIKIKICGLTNENDIQIVNRLGIDLAGFVLFFEKSKRYIELSRATELKNKLDGIKSVAVTVSPTVEQIAMIENAGFDYIQIHGSLDREIYEAVNIPIIRAFNVTNTSELSECERLDKIHAYVFDAAKPGSGKTFDWNTLSALGQMSKPMILSGGLNPDNVTEAINTVHPYGVDVSSGVELKEGGKSSELSEQFVKNVRAIDI